MLSCKNFRKGKWPCILRAVNLQKLNSEKQFRFSRVNIHCPLELMNDLVPFTRILFIFCKGCGSWTDWTTCDKSCQGGKMYRYRNCTKAYIVRGYEIETKPCNTQSCGMGKCQNIYFEFTLRGKQYWTSQKDNMVEENSFSSSSSSSSAFSSSVVLNATGGVFE